MDEPYFLIILFESQQIYLMIHFWELIKIVFYYQFF